MPRLKTVEPDQAQGKAKELFEGPLKDKQINIFKLMANSPAALNAYVQMSAALKQGELSDKEQEIIHLAASEENGCRYCLAAHTMLGKNAGLTEEQTKGARTGAIEGDPKLDALARFAKTLHEKKGWVDDEDVEKFKSAGYADAHIAEAIAVYALAVYTNYFNHVAQSELDFPQAPALT